MFSLARSRLLTVSTSGSLRAVARRGVSSAALSKFQALKDGSRDRYIDVYTPSSATGTLTRYDLPAAYDSLANDPDFGAVHRLCEDAPYHTRDGGHGLLYEKRFAQTVHESLPNLTDKVISLAEEAKTDDQALARLAILKNAYAHMINNYCYEPCRHMYEQTHDPNEVGQANPSVPPQLSQPRTVLCALFDDETDLRWQNYNEYSPANCRVLDPAKPLTMENVTTMVRGEGSPDEIGFITNHYVQERKTTGLIKAAYDLAAAAPQKDLDSMVVATERAHLCMADINATNKEMPQWCKPEGYATLRIWIPGPQGHSGPGRLFPQSGVRFEGSAELGAPEFDMSRGETGAMTSIIALARTLSMFEYSVAKFGENELTHAQADFNLRRETGQRRFLRQTKQALDDADLAGQALAHPSLLYHMIRLRYEVITHNLTHYGYSRNYIFDNTKAGTQSLFEATGGTTHSFLPTSALANITSTLELIDALQPMKNSLVEDERQRVDEIEHELRTSQAATERYRSRFAELEQQRKKKTAV